MCEHSEKTIRLLRERWNCIYYSKMNYEPDWIQIPKNKGDNILLKDVIIETIKNWKEFGEISDTAHRMSDFENWLKEFDELFDNDYNITERIKVDYGGLPEDIVLRLKEKYSSFNIDLRGIDFSSIDFVRDGRSDARYVQFFGVCLDWSKLHRCNLSKSKFWFCSLKGADLDNAFFTGASFYYADLSNADLGWCHLEGANLSGAKFINAKLRSIYFNDGTKVSLKTEFVTTKLRQVAAERKKRYNEATEIYGNIKNLYINNGLLSEANKFLFRERHCRDVETFRQKRLFKKIEGGFRLIFYDFLFKYALSPSRCLAAAFFVIIIWSGFYLWRFEELIIQDDAVDAFVERIFASIHFSVTSFSTVGFGDISPKIGTLAQIASNIEGIIGIIVLGIFIASILRTIK